MITKLSFISGQILFFRLTKLSVTITNNCHVVCLDADTISFTDSILDNMVIDIHISNLTEIKIENVVQTLPTTSNELLTLLHANATLK